jgi:hypothetical protein
MESAGQSRENKYQMGVSHSLGTKPTWLDAI